MYQLSGPEFFTLAYRSGIFPGAVQHRIRVEREEAKKDGGDLRQSLATNDDLSDLIEYSEV